MTKECMNAIINALYPALDYAIAWVNAYGDTNDAANIFADNYEEYMALSDALARIF